MQARRLSDSKPDAELLAAVKINDEKIEAAFAQLRALIAICRPKSVGRVAPRNRIGTSEMERKRDENRTSAEPAELERELVKYGR